MPLNVEHSMHKVLCLAPTWSYFSEWLRSTPQWITISYGPFESPDHTALQLEDHGLQGPLSDVNCQPQQEAGRGAARYSRTQCPQGYP